MITARIATAIDNPLNGVVPDFTIFGAEFTQLWQKLLAGLWGLALVLCVAFLILGLIKMGAASTSQNPNAHSAASKQAAMAGIGLGIVAAVAVIVGAILAIFG